jgi:hypothetical protein
VTDWGALKNRWSHLSDLSVGNTGGRVDILIGQDLNHLTVALESTLVAIFEEDRQAINILETGTKKLYILAMKSGYYLENWGAESSVRLEDGSTATWRITQTFQQRSSI